MLKQYLIVNMLAVFKGALAKKLQKLPKNPTNKQHFIPPRSQDWQAHFCRYTQGQHSQTRTDKETNNVTEKTNKKKTFEILGKI